MNSVLTNTGAMTALQVLNSVNKDLGVTQGRISTGLKVATADQNAAIFAIAGTMKADVAGYETIAEGLGLAESAVSVARSASENISELLKEMKTKIVEAQPGSGKDRTKLQNDITELKNQISSIASSASFNGMNYLAGEQGVSILSSLDRSTTDGANYTVSTGEISFTKQNLVFGSATPTSVETVAAGSTAVAAVGSSVDLDITLDPTTANNGQLSLKIGGVANTTTIDIGAAGDGTLATAAADIQTALQTDFGTGVTVTVTTDNKIRITDAQGRGITSVAEASAGAGQFNLNSTSDVSLGNTIQGAVESQTDYVFDNLKTGGNTTYATGMIANVTLTRADGTTVQVNTATQTSMANVATTLQTQLRAAAGGSATDYTVTWDATNGKLAVSDADGRGVAVRFEGEGAGKLGGLATLDVTTDAGAQQGMANIETWIQDTLDAAAALGSTQKRLGIQRDFLGKLVDALDTGIGTLVDADMTSESARLQSLQVQQQLGTQALSIANQQPQSLLSLFR